MRKSIIIYSILLVCLIGISLFLTSNFLDSSKANPNEVIVKNIFQADEVSLRISFNDTEIDFVIKSEMLNSLADSDFMRLFSPEIYFDNNKDLSIVGKSQNADFFYKTNIVEFKESTNFRGIFNDTEFSGRLGNLTINLKNNTAEILKGLELYHGGNIYLADSILIDLSLKKILNSVNVRFKTSND